MVLFDKENTQVITSAEGENISVVGFRSAKEEVPKSLRLLLENKIDYTGRLDLFSKAVYGISSKADYLLEFTDKPFWEWSAGDTIIAIHPNAYLLR